MVTWILVQQVLQKKNQWRSHQGGEGGIVPPLTAKICQKSGKRWEKSGKKRKKWGRKGKYREVSFTLPLLTDRAGYATEKNNTTSVMNGMMRLKLSTSLGAKRRRTLNAFTRVQQVACIDKTVWHCSKYV